ncbi:BTB/POZ domain-containing protein [Perilla frutescens var. hirtella]|uniref:BTB/POZ domain-containing protein n=1 Tax=Perilla frutescens var. hirtella TaxID=608512 RepID=A0AAD4IV03_PERFH|nr:BTB/POZ domain-containing protein [Perilla frutescens var. hirtella]KAH6822077.1 BTB/POZ domain-containing protein [Perilla frutescens var. hirtella]
MASDSNSNNTTNHHKSMSSRSHQQQLVSTMIKQGFISDPFLSPSRLSTLSPPPTYRALTSPNQSPTLFEVMSVEQPRPALEARKKLQERVSFALSHAPFKISDQWGAGDVRLTVAARAEAGEREAGAFRVTMDVHRRVLTAKSRYFADKLRRSGTHSVEILDCDDVAVYVEAVVLMYSAELKTKLLGAEVSKILALLQICSAIMFDDGIRACLEYLEAVPWSEGEEESVVSNLNQLQLDCSRTDTVLQRVVADPWASSRADNVFLKLSLGVLQAKDDKARREMKALISRLLREDPDGSSLQNSLDISRDTLYQLCHRCLGSLVLCLSEAACLDESRQDRGTLMAEISREADNMQWILGILTDRKMGDEFVKLWADQKELAILHSKIPTMYRHEISKITAQLCISMGKGKILVPKETRFALLSTWLEALYDDFGWMRMSGKSIDRKLIEEGLSQTILTLPLPQQQSILLKWFDRFLNRGDDCPNIQRAFEIWWRRAFVKQYAIESQLQLAVCGVPD